MFVSYIKSKQKTLCWLMLPICPRGVEAVTILIYILQEPRRPSDLACILQQAIETPDPTPIPNSVYNPPARKVSNIHIYIPP